MVFYLSAKLDKCGVESLLCSMDQLALGVWVPFFMHSQKLSHTWTSMDSLHMFWVLVLPLVQPKFPFFMLTLVADASTYHEGLLYGDAK